MVLQHIQRLVFIDYIDLGYFQKKMDSLSKLYVFIGFAGRPAIWYYNLEAYLIYLGSWFMGKSGPSLFQCCYCSVCSLDRISEVYYVQMLLLSSNFKHVNAV